jgi:hypothetical protein
LAAAREDEKRILELWDDFGLPGLFFLGLGDDLQHGIAMLRRMAEVYGVTPLADRIIKQWIEV